MKKLIGIIFLMLFIQLYSWSQQLNVQQREVKSGSSVVDDSTRQIYGPTTTRHFSQENIRYNLLDYQFVDTTIINYDLEFDLLARKRYEGQDLGNLGTAWRSHYFNYPDQIGARPGYESFRPYYKQPSDIRLYDTKSPYSWFAVQWGGDGRNVTEAKYSRNVDERWNFTLDYRSLLVDKLIGSERRGDRNVESYNYSLSSWYRSKNLKYAAFLILSRMRHEVTEMGGVDVDPINGTLSNYFEDTAQPLLRQTSNDELRKELFFYHRYELNKLISLFHEVQWGSQKNGLLVESSSESNSYFDYQEIPFDNMARDSATFQYFTNRAGITGYTRGFNYELYLKGRNVNYLNPYFESVNTSLDTKEFESYIGINVGTTIDSTFQIRANGELQTNGNYRLTGEIRSKILDGKAGIMQFSPGFMQQGYRGHYDYWTSNYNPISMRYADATLKVKRGILRLEPSLLFQNITGNIFFKKYTDIVGIQQVLPFQNAGSITIFSPGGMAGIKGDKGYVLFSGKLNTVGGRRAETMPMPEIMANLDVGITNTAFKESMIFQLGVRTHWQSSYYAMGYDPAIQQFYVQNDFKVPDYWFFTAYMNARIGKVKFFLKFNNIRKLFNPVGYFPTPEYPGINGLLDFGFKWYFYD